MTRRVLAEEPGPGVGGVASLAFPSDPEQTVSRYVYIAILAAALIALALGGWAVQGLRTVLQGPRRGGRRAELAPSF